MSNKKYQGNQVINGSHGKVWWNGELVFEVKSVVATVNVEREDVPIGMGMDSKVIGLNGEGTLMVNKVYSRNLRAMHNAYKRGEDPRADLVFLLDDPSATRKQKERTSIKNAWFNSYTLAQFEERTKLERELPFGFDPMESDVLETIEV